jgi:RNA polymerase sigma-70 factor (ECF subfamily)
MMFAPFARSAQHALVDGEPAVIATREGRRFSVMVFTVARDRVVEMSVIGDPARLPGLDLTVLND